MGRIMRWSCAEAGAVRISDGVHRIPLPLPTDGLHAVNIYLIEGETGLTCIDGGWAVEEARKQFHESLAELGYHPRDINSYLVTHVHQDHYTLAVALREEFGSHVSLGIGDQRSLALIRSGNGNDAFEDQLHRAGMPNVGDWASAAAFPANGPEVWQDPDTWITEDHTIDLGGRQLQVMQTPGHTAGHLVFADLDSGYLFAGDHILPTITPSVGTEAAPTRSPLASYLSSLARVRSLPDLTLLPAHGETGMSSHERIDQLLAHHDERLAVTFDAVVAGRSTAAEVAGELPWTRSRRRLADLDIFNRALAVSETVAHLDVLATRGQVELETIAGVTRYSAADTT